MSPFSTDRYGAELEGQTAALAGLLRGADMSRTVATCPEWTLTDLARHVGLLYRRAAEIIDRRSSRRVAMDDVPDPHMPDGDDARSAWLQAGVARLERAVRDAPPDVEIWSFLGARRPAFWLRRMVCEAAVHRGDAAITCGARFELAPELAADVISEALDVVPRVAARRGETAPTETLHVHATDEGLGAAGEWFVARADGGVRVEQRHAKGDVAVRGPASELLLVLLRRLPPTAPGVDVVGDTSALDRWLDTMRF